MIKGFQWMDSLLDGKQIIFDNIVDHFFSFGNSKTMINWAVCMQNSMLFNLVVANIYLAFVWFLFNILLLLKKQCFPRLYMVENEK